MSRDEVLIGSFIKDPKHPTLTIDVTVDSRGNVVLREYGKYFLIPNKLAEEISSSIYVAWENSEDVVAAHQAAETAKKLADQARQAVLDKISRGQQP
jgi:hypothetical protein